MLTQEQIEEMRRLKNDPENPMTFRQIGAKFNRSPMRIFQLIGPSGQGTRPPNIANLKKLYKYIEKHLEKKGRPPTRLQMVEQGLVSSKTMARCRLRQMERLGWVKVERGVVRGIRLLGIKES